MKPIDAKSSTYIDFWVKNRDIDPKFKVGDHVRIKSIKIFLLSTTIQIG